MNLQIAKITLEKINRLYSGMEADADNISAIERDLMKSYIRQLYEAVTDVEESTQSPVKTPPRPVPSTPVDVPEQPRQDSPRPAPVIEPVSTPAAPTPTPAPQQPQPAAPKSDGKEYGDLFDQEQSKSQDLADKLGGAPLNDLTRAFSINDRLYFTSELFSKNQDAFQQTLQKLNTMRDFSDARRYLIEEVAPNHDWTDQAKRAAAKAFVKVVRRRFGV